jgi:hypothetical protein
MHFGDSTVGRWHSSASSNSTRALIGSGVDTSGSINNAIDYITIATLGNAIDFGDLSTGKRIYGSTSSPTRVVWAGGIDPSTTVAAIFYSTISALGNAVSFGDLTSARYGVEGCSNGHGGL